MISLSNASSGRIYTIAWMCLPQTTNDYENLKIEEGRTLTVAVNLSGDVICVIEGRRIIVTKPVAERIKLVEVEDI